MKTSRPLSITHYQREASEDIQQKPLEFRLIQRLLGYTRPYRLKRNILFALVIIRSIQIPILAWLLGAVIKGPITNRDPDGVLRWSLAFLGMAFLTQFTLHFRQRLALELGESVMQDLRRDIFSHLMRMPMSFFDRTKLGRIISRVTSDADTVRVGVQDVCFVSLVMGGQMIVAGAAIFYYDWVMFLVLLAMTPMLWKLNLHFRQRLSQAHRAVQESFSRVTSTLAESVNGIRVTQGFVRQDLNTSLFRSLVADHSKYNLGAARASGIFLPLLEMHGQLFVAILLVVAGWQALRGDIPLGNVVILGFLANIFLSPIPQLGNLYNQALTAMAGAERIFHLLDSPPDWQDDPAAKPLPAIHGHVEFQHVSFAYTPDRPALRDISFSVEPGQSIALVGHTGSGKTSIINLLCKFYLPQSGAILIDNHNLLAVTGDSIHRQMSIVSQNNFLFTGSIMDNIRFGKPSATDAEIVEVIRQLDFLDLIGALPEGLATRAGERGSGISLGQRQLVCFARAMIVNPRILILDEATSAVDTLTELRIQRALSRLIAGRTSFIIAHRLSTIREADLILMLDHGRIIERGSHTQLLAAQGAYARLHQQFVSTADPTDFTPSSNPHRSPIRYPHHHL